MRILVDTSVWADHLRQSDAALIDLLRAGAVVMHPFVLGELALGNLQPRDATLAALSALPAAAIVDADAFLAFLIEHDLPASGLGFVDAHLLAAAAAGGMQLWTRDRRLAARAAAAGVGRDA